MVNSISKIVQNLIDEDLSLQDALQRDYANYSAIARLLIPKIKETMDSEINLESVITSVKRAKTNYTILQGKITEVVAGSDLNIRTDMAKVSVEKTQNTLKKIRKILGILPGEFLQVIEGNNIVTIISNITSFSKIFSNFTDKEVIAHNQNLATIIIRSPSTIVNTPGCVQAFYNAISRKHINIEETMSCYTETIIVLAMEDVSKAFSALTNLISKARKLI